MGGRCMWSLLSVAALVVMVLVVVTEAQRHNCRPGILRKRGICIPRRRGNPNPAAVSSRPQSAAFRPEPPRPPNAAPQPTLFRPQSSIHLPKPSRPLHHSKPFMPLRPSKPSSPQRPFPPPSRPDTCGRSCSGIYDPVCASDGVSYGNQCEFEASKCRNPSIQVIGSGRCK